MRKRFAILGLGDFGSALARELSRLGCEVLAVDRAPRHVENLKDDVARAVVADIRDRDAMKELFDGKFDAAVIAIGENLEASILATLYLRELGVETVWAEATGDDRREVLQRVGATEVIAPEAETGRRIAQRLVSPNLVEYLPLTGGQAVWQIEAPEWALGKSLAELDIRRRFEVAIVSIQRADGSTAVVPGGDQVVEAGDELTVVGGDDQIERFREGK